MCMFGNGTKINKLKANSFQIDFLKRVDYFLQISQFKSLFYCHCWVQGGVVKGIS